MEEYLYSPAVHLFAFHLIKAPNAAESTTINSELLWQKCQTILAQFGIKQPLPLRSDVPANSRADMLAGKADEFLLPLNTVIDSNRQKTNLKGFVYPLQLYNSYGLVLSLGYPDPKKNEAAIATDIGFLEQLNPNGCFLPDEIASNLGQTLLITAWLNDAQPRDTKALKALADRCVERFVPEAKQRPPFSRQGQLFESPIFEYGLIKQPKSYRHLLVWFLNDSSANQKFSDCYQRLIDLFFYRNKIIRDFRQSRKTYQDAYLEYEEIEKLISKTLLIVPQTEALSQETLNDLKTQLKQILQQALEYANLLRDLQFYQNSIAINTDNYQEKLQLIQDQFDPDIDLSFLATFVYENCPTLQSQIQADLSYFVHGSQLLDKAISSIRGIVEVDQAERERESEEAEKQRDRQLQNTIEALGAGIGAGIGAGGIFVASYGLVTPEDPIQWQPSLALPFHPFILSLFWSLLFGLGTGLLTWRGVRAIQTSKAKIELPQASTKDTLP